MDKVADLRAIISIHDTTLGPAIGGVRLLHYGSEEDALAVERRGLLLDRAREADRGLGRAAGD